MRFYTSRQACYWTVEAEASPRRRTAIYHSREAPMRTWDKEKATKEETYE